MSCAYRKRCFLDSTHQRLTTHSKTISTFVDRRTAASRTCCSSSRTCDHPATRIRSNERGTYTSWFAVRSIEYTRPGLPQELLAPRIEKTGAHLAHVAHEPLGARDGHPRVHAVADGDPVAREERRVPRLQLYHEAAVERVVRHVRQLLLDARVDRQQDALLGTCEHTCSMCCQTRQATYDRSIKLCELCSCDANRFEFTAPKGSRYYS